MKASRGARGVTLLLLVILVGVIPEPLLGSQGAVEGIYTVINVPLLGFSDATLISSWIDDGSLVVCLAASRGPGPEVYLLFMVAGGTSDSIVYSIGPISGLPSSCQYIDRGLALAVVGSSRLALADYIEGSYRVYGVSQYGARVLGDPVAVSGHRVAVPAAVNGSPGLLVAGLPRAGGPLEATVYRLLCQGEPVWLGYRILAATVIPSEEHMLSSYLLEYTAGFPKTYVLQANISLLEDSLDTSLVLLGEGRPPQGAYLVSSLSEGTLVVGRGEGKIRFISPGTPLIEASLGSGAYIIRVFSGPQGLYIVYLTGYGETRILALGAAPRDGYPLYSVEASPGLALLPLGLSLDGSVLLVGGERPGEARLLVASLPGWYEGSSWSSRDLNISIVRSEAAIEWEDTGRLLRRTSCGLEAYNLAIAVEEEGRASAVNVGSGGVETGYMARTEPGTSSPGSAVPREEGPELGGGGSLPVVYVTAAAIVGVAVILVALARFRVGRRGG
ncbi:MAG: hypothetical protein LRS43_04720 [Desulfurococcales archaeon]|nr:hypothetical protein [Desulfurococcales archaeon]